MVFKSRINSDTRARIYYLRNLEGLTVRKVAEMYDVSRGSVIRIAKEKVGKRGFNKTKGNRGRPRKLTTRQARSIRRLRIEEGSFSTKLVMEGAGIAQAEISVRTVTMK